MENRQNFIVCLVKFVFERLKLMLIYCQAIDSCDNDEILLRGNQREKKYKARLSLETLIKLGFAEESLSKKTCLMMLLLNVIRRKIYRHD